MTIIIAHPREGVLAADRFQVVINNDYAGIQDSRVDYVEKIVVTEDRHFAYVFDNTVESQDVAVILNFLTRFERGALPKDELLMNVDDKSYMGWFMSRKRFYKIVATKGIRKVDVKILNYYSINKTNVSAICLAHFDFSVNELFVLCRKLGMANSGDLDRIKQSSLKAIHPARKRKAK